jgi:hypothetical protein
MGYAGDCTPSEPLVTLYIPPLAVDVEGNQ